MQVGSQRGSRAESNPINGVFATFADGAPPEVCASLFGHFPLTVGAVAAAAVLALLEGDLGGAHTYLVVCCGSAQVR